MVGQSGVSQISPQQIIAEPPHGLASHPAQSATIGLDSKPYANLQIFEQCGVGPDAVAYRAVRQAERDEVEVRVLSGPIREGDRWAALLKRLRLVQLANSHAITRLLLTQLDAQPPRLIMEKAGETARSRAFQ
jgi:hypothetical protein